MTHTRVFIDGSEGTTGLELRARLASYGDALELLAIDPERHRDPAARAELLNAADIVFLCLPDAAAREAAALITNPVVRVIDASTAHRVAPGWTYGFPELHGAREAIRASRRVAVPGCHATGFIALVRPLVESGLLPADARLSCHSVSGYSGGGKKLIAAYEGPRRPGDSLRAPRYYGLSLTHKHLPEMRAVCGLAHAPLFTPAVGDFYRGMAVTVPLFAPQLAPGARTAEALREFYAEYYRGEPFVTAAPEGGGDLLDAGFLSPTACNGTNSLQIFVFSNHAAAPDDRQIFLAARLDNLGKGASGAAAQCLNLLLGLPEDTGLKTASASK